MLEGRGNEAAQTAWRGAEMRISSGVMTGASVLMSIAWSSLRASATDRAVKRSHRGLRDARPAGEPLKPSGNGCRLWRNCGAPRPARVATRDFRQARSARSRPISQHRPSQDGQALWDRQSYTRGTRLCHHVLDYEIRPLGLPARDPGRSLPIQIVVLEEDVLGALRRADGMSRGVHLLDRKSKTGLRRADAVFGAQLRALFRPVLLVVLLGGHKASFRSGVLMTPRTPGVFPDPTTASPPAG